VPASTFSLIAPAPASDDIEPNNATFWERLSPLGRTVAGAAEFDLRPSGIDGFMDDPEADEEESWR
jgi:hypothetical protein